MLMPEEISILYLEDDDLIADLMLEYLSKSKRTKFNVIHKFTLAEGLDILRTECPDVDVILLDLILPNSHGIETYKSLIQVCDHIPVVIISGHEDLACECIKLGAQDYLIKSKFTDGLLKRSIKYAIERSKLENSKIEAEKKYKEVIHSTPIGFHNYHLKDDQLILVGANPAADKILNVDNSQFLDKTIEDAFPNLADTVIPERYKEVATTGKPWSGGVVEYEDDNIDKGFFRVHVFRTAPNYITVSFEDVTQQILAERNFRNLVEVTKAGIYKLDILEQRFTYVNDVASKQLGYTREEMVKLGPKDILTDKSYTDWLGRWKALQNGEFIDNSFEYQVVHKDGSLLWALITAEYTEDTEGNVVSANVVAIDITDRKLAEQRASQKEDDIFNELEDRLHQWREEINVKSVAETNKLLMLDQKLSLMTNNEVA